MTVFEIDNNEPLEVERLLRMALDGNVERTDLNARGWADYMWLRRDGTPVHVERKHWSEILSNIDHVEEQLRQHLQRQPAADLVLMLEGVSMPAPGGVATYRPAKDYGNNVLFIQQVTSSRPLSMLYAWLYQVSQYLVIMPTSGLTSTAAALAAMYKSDQKAEHRTFRRYLKKAEWHPNPQVSMLVGIVDGVGQQRAEALIAHFGTVWNVLSAKPNQLAAVNGIGLKTAERMLRSIGRPDV